MEYLLYAGHCVYLSTRLKIKALLQKSYGPQGVQTNLALEITQGTVRELPQGLWQPKGRREGFQWRIWEVFMEEQISGLGLGERVKLIQRGVWRG